MGGPSGPMLFAQMRSNRAGKKSIGPEGPPTKDLERSSGLRAAQAANRRPSPRSAPA
ncbi:DUF6053 domain-containing protein [Lysobacter capsici]|uniref:DUF6053 domain-containing protein n=1 Tax=Lysobacter capsici TaxID=435897 RepID=UPI003D2F8D6C